MHPRVARVIHVSVLRRLYSTTFWGFLVLSSALLFPVAVLLWAVTAPFDRRRAALHRFTCLWASLYTWTNPLWPVTIEGREHIDPGETYVMVANHLSLLDILVLFRLFTHFKWVSKAENFSVPLIGWNMRLNGYLPLRRGNPASAREMLAAAERTLAGGSSVLMFPEGTRSSDGRLRPFKRGAFELALRAQVALLPIVITGTADALPRRGFVLRGRHPIRIRVLEPVPYASFAELGAEALTRQLRERFAAALGEPGQAGGPGGRATRMNRGAVGKGGRERRHLAEWWHAALSSGKPLTPVSATETTGSPMADRPTVQLRHSRMQVLNAAPPLERYGDKRRCSAPGCTTVLSRYNPSACCARHAGWSDDGRRRRD